MLVLCEEYNPDDKVCLNCPHGKPHFYDSCKGLCINKNGVETWIDCKPEDFIKEKEFRI